MLMVVTTHPTSSLFVNNHLESGTIPFSLKTTSIASDLNDKFKYTFPIRVVEGYYPVVLNSHSAETAPLLFNHLTPDSPSSDQ